MKAFTDGACRKSNPGLCSCAFVVYDGELFYKQGLFLGPTLHTNNYAEYMGLVTLLEWAALTNTTKLRIYSDSKLVVEQVNSNWNILKQELKDLRARAWGLLMRGGHTLEHTKGHAGVRGNEEADELCNEILDQWETEHAQSNL